MAPEGVNSLQSNFYITQMKDLVLGSSKVKEKGCKKHSKPHSYFCSTCEVQICVDCCNSDHRNAAGHCTQDLIRARQEQRHFLEVEVAEAQETILSAKPKIKSLDAEMGCLFAANNQAEADVDAAFDRYTDMLKKRKEILKEDLKRLYRFRRQALSECIEMHNKQITSLDGLLEQCREVATSGNITDLIAYKTKLMSKNHELRNQRSHAAPIDNFLKFDSEESQNNFTDIIQDMGSVTLSGCLPAYVKAFEQPVVAGLHSSMSFDVKGANGEPLSDYPITLKIIDTYDDPVHCKTKHRTNGTYEATFRPTISGLHRVKVQFLDHVILGGDFNLNVLSNNPVAIIGVRGSEDAEMEYPRAVTTASDGSLYIVDTGNNRIQVVTQTGDFLFAFPVSHESQSFSSCGIAIQKDERTVICPEVQMCSADMARSDTLLMYSLEGRLLHRLNFGDTLSKALCIAVNSMGQVIVVDFELNAVFIFDKQVRRLLKKFGERGSGPGQFEHPTFVCIGEDDTIIVSDGDNHRIQVFDKMGNFLYQFGKKGNGKGEITLPFGVVADLHGNILVVDGGNKRIQVYKTGGEFVSSIESLGDRLNAPRGIAVTTDGFVLVADRDNHCIKKYKYLHSTIL